MPIPLLLLLSGPPGAEKTTLGTRLAHDLRLPFFNKDGIKETLFDTPRWKDRAWFRQLGVASTALLFYCIEQQLEAGQSVVVERSFQAAYDVHGLEALKQMYLVRVLENFCTAELEVLLAHFQQRALSNKRHPGMASRRRRKSCR